MAQTPDGSGTAPVRITNSSTSVTSGVGVTQKLVGAAIAFGNVLRGTFGPNGLDKMLYKTNGEVYEGSWKVNEDFNTVFIGSKFDEFKNETSVLLQNPLSFCCRYTVIFKLRGSI